MRKIKGETRGLVGVDVDEMGACISRYIVTS